MLLEGVVRATHQHDGRAGRRGRARMSWVRAGSLIGSSRAGRRQHHLEPGRHLDLRQPFPSLRQASPRTGHQPSASVAARRSERSVRPPTQIGTCSCIAHGSTTMSVEVVELAVVGRFGTRQRGAKRPQRVVAAWPAVVERRADEVELLLRGADADPQDQPAVADHVQRAVALGDLERVVIREHQHVGRQPDVLGARGQVAEGGQWIPVARSAPLELGCRQRDVLAAREVVVAETVCGLGDLRDVIDRGGPLPTCRTRPGASSPRACRSTTSAIAPASSLHVRRRRRRGSTAP